MTTETLSVSFSTYTVAATTSQPERGLYPVSLCWIMLVTPDRARARALSALFMSFPIMLAGLPEFEVSKLCVCVGSMLYVCLYLTVSR